MRARRISKIALILVLMAGLPMACGGGSGGGGAIGSLRLLPVVPGSVGGGPQVGALTVRAVHDYYGTEVPGVTVSVRGPSHRRCRDRLRRPSTPVRQRRCRSVSLRRARRREALTVHKLCVTLSYPFIPS